MKNIKTTMSRLIAVFATLVLLASAVLIPASAVAPGSDPILSGSEYGVSYNDGVYTLSLDAERLVEIISTRSFNKETLKSIMPEAVYELLKNRDLASAKALLRDLYAASDLDKLIEDLPLDVIASHISKEDLLSVVDADKLFNIFDVKGIIASLTTEEIEKVFEGKDISTIVPVSELEEYINAHPAIKDAIVDDILNGKYGPILTPDDVNKVSHADLLTYIPAEDLAQLILNKGPVTLLKMADLRYISSLPAVRSELKSIKLADIKAAVNFSVIKNDLLPEIAQFVLGDIKYVKLNDSVVFLNGQIDVAALELAALNALPTFDKVADLGADGKVASFIVSALIEDKTYSFGFEIKFTGDTTGIKAYAEKLADYVSVQFGANGLIDVNINTPAKLAELYIKALDTNKLPAKLREKLSDIAILEFNQGDIQRVADAVMSKLTIAELKDLLNAVDVGKYDDILLDKLNLYESQAEVLRNYIVKAVNKACTIIDTSATVTDMLSAFYNKSISDFYVGDSVFKFNGDATIDLIDFAEKIVDLPDFVDNILTNTTVHHELNLTAKITGLYRVDFIDQGEILYSAFRTEGCDLTRFVSDDKLAFIAPYGWASENGSMLTTMPAHDVQIAALHSVTFLAYDKDGNLSETYVKYYSEFNDLSDFPYPPGIYPPALPNDIPHYYFLWSPLELSGGDLTVIGKYYPIRYTATFMNGSDVWAELNYTVNSFDSIVLPELPVKEGYNVSWDITTLPLDNVTVNAVFEELEYSVKFYADGTLVDTQYYTVNDKNITVPAVPAKEGYTGAWETYELSTGDIIVNAIYTPVVVIPETYTVTFKADGIIIDTITLNKGDTNLTEPAVPAKAGYTGAWENYTLDDTNITVNAVYTANEYTITFKADGVVVDTITFTVETMNSVVAPTVPAKAGYTAAWENYTLALENIEVEAVYTAIEYTITFKADGVVVDTITFTADTMNSVVAPTVPAKAGYTAAWENYTLALENIEVEAVYTAIEYTITFIADGKVIEIITFTIDTMNSVVAPAVPAKENYTGAWENYTLALENIEVEAVYTAIEYTITFKADDKVIASIKFNKGATSVDEPTVPAKAGYTGVWSTYSLKDADGDITVEAQYTAIQYKVFFYADGKLIDTKYYTVENRNITEPAVPAKEGFTGVWETYSLNGTGDVTVTAKYTAIPIPEYTVTFKADGKVIKTITFKKGATSVDEPAVPAKAGYTGAWASYSIKDATGNIEVEAVYTAIEYTITFKANGTVVDTITFTAATMNSVVAPAVPAKTGYTGAWKSYTLALENIEVEAVYTAIEYTANFMIGNELFQSVKFTVEDTKEAILGRVNELTDKAGYTKAWSDFEVAANDLTINAVYTLISYSVTFKADGNVIATLYYTVENPTITAPEVPAKEGFTGAWESYELTTGDIVVNAIYTENPVVDPPIGDTDGIGVGFWWIMAGVLVVALGVLFGIFKKFTKKKAQ